MRENDVIIDQLLIHPQLRSLQLPARVVPVYACVIPMLPVQEGANSAVPQGQRRHEHNLYGASISRGLITAT